MNTLTIPIGSDDERAELVQAAIAIIRSRDNTISRADLARETGKSRAYVDAIFETEDELLQAIGEGWFAEEMAIMEEVLASDLGARDKMLSFLSRRFAVRQQRYEADPAGYAKAMEFGNDHFESMVGFIEFADHCLSHIIAEAQAEGFMKGLSIDHALSLVNQMVLPYVYHEALVLFGHRLSQEKLARIVDTIFAGLSGEDDPKPVPPSISLKVDNS